MPCSSSNSQVTLYLGTFLKKIGALWNKQCRELVYTGHGTRTLIEECKECGLNVQHT